MFTVNQVYNCPNDRVIVDQGDSATPVNKTKHPAGVMVLGIVTSDGKTCHLRRQDLPAHLHPNRPQGQHRGLHWTSGASSGPLALPELSGRQLRLPAGRGPGPHLEKDPGVVGDDPVRILGQGRLAPLQPGPQPSGLLCMGRSQGQGL